MKLLLQTTNPAVISFARHLLAGHDIEAFVMDANMSVLEGSIGILPSRVMVADEEYDKALWVIRRSKLADELKE